MTGLSSFSAPAGWHSGQAGGGGGQHPSSAAILGFQRPLEEVALGRLLAPIAISCHVPSSSGFNVFPSSITSLCCIFSHLPPAGYFPSGWSFFHSPCLVLTSLDPASPSASLTPSGQASPARCLLCLIPWPQGFGALPLAPLGWLWVGCEVSVACCLLDLCALLGLIRLTLSVASHPVDASLREASAPSASSSNSPFALLEWQHPAGPSPTPFLV